MNSSRNLSLLAAAVAVVITVSLKLGDNFGTVQQKLSSNLEQASASLLARQGFAIETENHYGFFQITARQNDCQLQLHEAIAEGANLEAIKANAPPGAKILFEYQGTLSQTHPTLRATISKMWNRLKWRFGVHSLWSPVISIAAVGPCAIETLHWNELATIEAN